MRRANECRSGSAVSSLASSYAYTCFDGTRGTGRISNGRLGRGNRPGSRRWSEAQYTALPPGTLHVKGQSVCATVRGMPFVPASILRRPMRRAPPGPFQASALPIVISRVATTDLTSCAQAFVRRAQSGQLLPRRLGRIDQTERPRAGKSVSGWEAGAWPSMSDLRLANSPAQKSRNVRTRAGVAQIGVSQEPQFALGPRGAGDVSCASIGRPWPMKHGSKASPTPPATASAKPSRVLTL
jgi:hypothetical protein